MMRRDETPMTVEWIRRLRDEHHEQTKQRPRDEVWREDQETAQQAAEALGITLVDGPGQPHRTRSPA